jgi:hypothetical protein
MLRNCNTSIFSQEYCFPDKHGLSDSLTRRSVHSALLDSLNTIGPNESTRRQRQLHDIDWKNKQFHSVQRSGQTERKSLSELPN